MPTQCFMLTPTDRALRSLRRYAFRDRAGACPADSTGLSGHGSAGVPIGPAPLRRTPEGDIQEEAWPRDDPRWPQRCTCGYTFSPHDMWIVDLWQIYLMPDGRECSTHHGLLGDLLAAPAGAMWIADYIPPGDAWSGPDGLCLMLRLPDGHDWMIDGPSRSGGRWERSGTPPLITARPSIASPGYHGWLNNGILSDDLEGRSYP